MKLDNLGKKCLKHRPSFMTQLFLIVRVKKKKLDFLKFGAESEVPGIQSEKGKKMENEF